MTVSQLAGRAGVSPDTLRYYGKIGLLRPPRRTEAGYRLFDEAARARLAFIKGAQRLSLRHDDVKQLLEVMDKGLCPCGHTDRFLRTRMAEVDAEIARLTALRAAMQNTLESCPGDCSDPACWPCGLDACEGGKGVSDGCV